MTIIVYDRVNDKVYCDRCHTFTGYGKTRYYDRTKVNKIPVSISGRAVEVTFCSTGTLEDSTVGLYLAAAVQTYAAGFAGELPFSIAFIRLVARLHDGSVVTNNDTADGKSVLSVISDTTDIPFSTGGGQFFFDAYMREHDDIEKALQLTCEHAEGCGFGLESF